MAIADSELIKLINNKQVLITPAANVNEIKGVTIPLHLGNEFIDINEVDRVIKPEEDNNSLFEKVTQDSYILKPGSLTLAMTLEKITLPSWLVGRLDGRSRLARLGITVHITAHRIDPNFNGHIVLEIYNCSKNSIELTAGQEIGALLLDNIIGEVERPYDSSSSNYKNQTGVRL